LMDAKLNTPLDVRSQAIKQVEQIRAKLEQQKLEKELGAVEDLKRMMRPLGADRSDTPVGKLAEGLAKGDFKAARDALDQLKLDLMKAPTTEEEKRRAEELAKQLEALSRKLGQLAQEQKA